MSKLEIKSPLPGMFYRRPSPEAPPFRNDGDPVTADDVIGLVEVMKSFHEVKAGVAGKAIRFLVEYADAVMAAGMIFVGPSGAAIRLLGDKVAARQVAAMAGVPTVPGSDGRVLDLIEARAIVSKIGFPVMIKAAAGGGGRGIRIAQDFDEFDRQFPQAAAEATAAFGDGGLYLEKVIEKARHVEVQILGDGTNFVHCLSA